MSHLAPVIPLHPPHRQYLTKRQLADVLGFSERWVDYRRKEGMPAHDFGEIRFLLPECEAWLESRQATKGKP